MQTINNWAELKSMSYRILNPSINILKKTGITPNIITTIGFGITLLAATVLIVGAEVGQRGDYHYFLWFGITILLAGVFDMLDGQLARSTQQMSKFGAFYDSVLDRYSELVMFLGICYYLVAYHYFLSSLFAFVAMIGSIMVSYIRSRAESLNVECKVGMMQRPERVLTIGISAIVYGIVSSITGNFVFRVDWLPFPLFDNISLFTIPIFIMAVLTNYTAYQRLQYCFKNMKNNN